MYLSFGLHCFRSVGLPIHPTLRRNFMSPTLLRLSTAWAINHTETLSICRHNANRFETIQRHFLGRQWFRPWQEDRKRGHLEMISKSVTHRARAAIAVPQTLWNSYLLHSGHSMLPRQNPLNIISVDVPLLILAGCLSNTFGSGYTSAVWRPTMPTSILSNINTGSQPCENEHMRKNKVLLQAYLKRGNPI